MVAIVILAAGASHRFGGENKLLLPWGEGTLLTHIIDTALSVDYGECIVVLGHESGRLQSHLDGYSPDLKLVINEHYSQGLTGSIQTGVSCASDQATGYLLLPSDLPLIQKSELEALIAAHRRSGISRTNRIVVPIFAGTRSNPVIFPASLKKTILAHKEKNGCRAILESHAHQVFEVVMDRDHVLQDIDTKADYDRLKAAASA